MSLLRLAWWCAPLAGVLMVACSSPKVPPNACTDGNGGCDPHATCTDVNGTPTCSCIAGYQGTGLVCTVVSVCAVNNGGCDPQATCSESNGLPVCACKSGYVGDGDHCVPMPDCGADNGGCDPNAACSPNLLGTVDCTCDLANGYYGDGLTCTSCAQTACSADETCVPPSDPTGTPACQCKQGYELSGSGCVSIDYCGTRMFSCPAESTCMDTPGSYECPCDQGYDMSDGGCESIDYCCTNDTPGCVKTVTCPGDSMCVDTPGSYTCACDPGYQMEGTHCESIDFCCTSSGSDCKRTDDCSANAACADTPGSFTCTCNSGYSGDGGTCASIDFCGTGQDDCPANSKCKDTPGSYSCSCSPGYMETPGDGGFMCSEVNACTSSTTIDCSQIPNTMCVSTGPGEAACACDTGYEADADAGTGCDPIDHCNDPVSPCDQHAKCTYTTPGEYNCECNTGWAGNGVTCSPYDFCDLGVPQGSSTPMPACPSDALCMNTPPGSYTCTCDSAEGFSTNADGTCQSHYLQVAVGDRHMCAIRQDDGMKPDGSLWCWGWNDLGQLGNSSTDTAGPLQVPAEVPVSNSNATKWVYVAAGSDDTCGIMTDRSLWCWGSNANGQIGDGSATMSIYASPTQIGSGIAWSTVATQGGHTCAVTTGGVVNCWGQFTSGQLGISPEPTQLVASPTPITSGAGVTYTSIALGTGFSCGLENTSILCWGSNALGQLAQPLSTTSEITATAIASVTPPEGVSQGWMTGSLMSGESNSCALLMDHSLWCWGSNVRGQIGNNNNSDTPVTQPTEAMSSSESSGQWEQAAIGGTLSSTSMPGWGHTCAIDMSGNVWCWGDNSSSQSGTGLTTPLFLEPQAVMLPSGSSVTFQSISAGGVYTCAIDDMNQLWCWGQPPTLIYTAYGSTPTLETQ